MGFGYGIEVDSVSPGICAEAACFNIVVPRVESFPDMESPVPAQYEAVVVECNLVEVAVVQRSDGVESAGIEYPDIGCIGYVDFVVAFIVDFSDVAFKDYF